MLQSLSGNVVVVDVVVVSVFVVFVVNVAVCCFLLNVGSVLCVVCVISARLFSTYYTATNGTV